LALRYILQSSRSGSEWLVGLRVAALTQISREKEKAEREEKEEQEEEEEEEEEEEGGG
jgi:hypothetical protein